MSKRNREFGSVDTSGAEPSEASGEQSTAPPVVSDTVRPDPSPITRADAVRKIGLILKRVAPEEVARVMRACAEMYG